MDFNSEVCGPEIVVLEEGLNGGAQLSVVG